MVAAILGIISSALAIWEHKLKYKYVDKEQALKKAYFEAINRPPDQLNDAEIDNLEFEIKLLAFALAAEMRMK